MRVRTLERLITPQGELPAGRIVIIPDSLLEKLRSKVTPIYGQAWLTPDGALRVSGAVADLIGEIVRLTANNLQLQKSLLRRHCEAYDHHHYPTLVAMWAERAAFMEYDGGMTKEQAETEAAKLYGLEAFLPELLQG